MSDQRLGSLRADGFKTVYADLGEYLEVFDQPESRTQRTRLGQLDGELRRAETSLHSYLTTLQAIVARHERLRDPDPDKRLRLGFAISWFDGTAPDVPPVEFGAAGEAPAAFHLIDMLAALPEAYVLVMAYRNFTAGDDGSIAHVLDELDHAREAGAACGIVVGQEFNKVTPEKLTFWWPGRAAFWRAAEELAGALAVENDGYAQFRGISVNDLTAYQAARA